MPKDKTATHEKLVPIIWQEFLEYGFEKTSVNHIAALAGMSAAGLYRHYRDKEDMFASLVEETVTAYDQLAQAWQNGTTQHHAAYNPFGEVWIQQMLDFVYEHFDALKLLINGSAGSRFEGFEEQLIAREEDSSKAYAKVLKQAGQNPIELTDAQWHLVATLYIRAVTEIVRHDMTREQAEKHMDFLREFLYPGMKGLFGLS